MVQFDPGSDGNSQTPVVMLQTNPRAQTGMIDSLRGAGAGVGLTQR